MPYAEAGEIFFAKARIRKAIAEPLLINSEREEVQLWAKDIKNFNKWFEEVKELELPKEFFYVLINKIASVNYLTFSFDKDDKKKYIKHMEECKSIGNYFETQEEALKYFEYLRAKKVIKESARGFKPDWHNYKEEKYYAFWDTRKKELDYMSIQILQTNTIYFKSEEAIKESFEKHPEEWRTYLTYEQ